MRNLWKKTYSIMSLIYGQYGAYTINDNVVVLSVVRLCSFEVLGMNKVEHLFCFTVFLPCVVV